MANYTGAGKGGWWDGKGGGVGQARGVHKDKGAYPLMLAAMEVLGPELGALGVALSMRL